jgi:hypothetical protein
MNAKDTIGPLSTDTTEKIRFKDVGSGYTVDEEDGCWIALCHKKEHAEFIVTACNAHDDLVAALSAITEMAERCDSWESFPSAPIDAARAALAKAGAA